MGDHELHVGRDLIHLIYCHIPSIPSTHFSLFHLHTFVHAIPSTWNALSSTLISTNQHSPFLQGLVQIPPASHGGNFCAWVLSLIRVEAPGAEAGVV